MKLRKRLLSLMLAIALVVLCAGCGKKEEVVISYNSPQLWVNWGNVLSSFSKETGITAPNDNKNAGQTLSALIAEKNSPVADTAYLSITYAIKSESEDVMAPYKPAFFDQIPDTLKHPDGLWFTVHYGSVAILCNTEALGDRPVPQSYADLQDPMYKGLIAFYDPPSSGVGYSVCTNINLAMGGTFENWQPCVDYFKKLSSNDVMYPKQDATARLMKGEIGILVAADFTGYTCKYAENAPVEVVIPAEGSIRIPYTMSLVKNAPHEENAKKLIEYCLSPAGQRLFAEGYVRPMDTSALTDELKEKFLPDSDYERVIELDYAKMAEVQDTFMDIWVNEVFSG